METYDIIFEMVKASALIYGFRCISFSEVRKKSYIAGTVAFVVLTGIWTELRNTLLFYPGVHFFVEIFLIALYVGISFRGDKFFHICKMYLLLTLLEGVEMFLRALPLLPVFTGEVQREPGVGSAVIFGAALWGYMQAVVLTERGRRCLSACVSNAAQVGTAVLCGMLQISFEMIRPLDVQLEASMLQRGMFCVNLMGIFVLYLWLADQYKEQEERRELLAYAHRMREILPAVNRLVSRITEGPREDTEYIKEELIELCGDDMRQRNSELLKIKTFESTKSPLLDEQLNYYLLEAALEGIQLDIFVQASVKEMAEEAHIPVVWIARTVGDLYRNAHKAVKKKGTDGRILICFGYNPEGMPEIAVYDNGDPFPEYVWKHLGERGVTEGGTGHGLADILEILNKTEGSFLLCCPGETNVFEKGVCIVLDGKRRIESDLF